MLIYRYGYYVIFILILYSYGGIENEEKKRGNKREF